MIRFEVKKRDVLARTSRLLHDDTIYELPSAQDVDGIFPSLADRALSNVPLYAGKGFVENYHTRGQAEPFSIHPLSDDEVQSGSVVMVSNWHTALDNPRQYVEWLVNLKSRLPSDTVWYAPAAATPGNVHMLLYSGFDLFDFHAVDLCTARNQFCIPEGTFSSEAMDRAGCCCPGCVEGDLWAHNRWVLRQAIAIATLFIEQGRLRDLMEARCRLYPSQVAVLRHLDMRRDFLGRYTPVVRASPLLAATEDSLRRVEVWRFGERVIHRYLKPNRYDVAVLLPCSARKPYSLSQSHRKFLSAMAGRGHALIVTSPLGLVPRELEGVYPAAHYDVPVTGYWDREELAFAASMIENYMRTHPYRRVIAHLEGGALRAAEMGAEACGIDLEKTTCGSPTDERSLLMLQEALEGEGRLKDDRISGLFSWQFGRAVDTRGMAIRGRFGDQAVYRGGTRLFSLDPGTGLLKPTLEGWNLVEEGYRVTIDDFVPQGDILVPGIISADEKILEGDEVLVKNERVIVSGRAAMGAYEMLHSGHGVAVRVRKVKRL